MQLSLLLCCVIFVFVDTVTNHTVIQYFRPNLVLQDFMNSDLEGTAKKVENDIEKIIQAAENSAKLLLDQQEDSLKAEEKLVVIQP